MMTPIKELSAGLSAYPQNSIPLAKCAPSIDLIGWILPYSISEPIDIRSSGTRRCYRVRLSPWKSVLESQVGIPLRDHADIE
jgi:hypothetical protein